MPQAIPTLDEVKEAFAFLDDWEDRYRYIMDLGEKLSLMPVEDRVDSNLIHGCQSVVWVSLHRDDGIVTLLADSDSGLVKGLAALVVIALQGMTPEEIVRHDLGDFFSTLQLHEHLSPTRSNGLHGMIQQVRARAAEMAAC
ncbi:MAG: SufE family protein [Phycisphaerales bacterium]|nr:SufE family protein [Phycisphaerales bacterium]